MPISVVLADDHPLVLDGLARLFEQETGFTVLARCSDGAEALLACEQHRPDILVLDLRMPRMSGLELLHAMSGRKLSTRVVVLTAAADEDEVLEAVRLGVKGVVLKEMAPRLLVQCIRQVHAGGQWLEKQLAGRALERLLHDEAATRNFSAILTPREIEILRLVSSGLRNKEIARKLSITEGTVKMHVHNVYEKLGLDTRVDLATYARDRGIV